MARSRKLSDNLTVDEIAALTEADMVRRRFDMSNVRWIGVLSVVTFVISFVEVMMALFDKGMAPHVPPFAVAHFFMALAAVGMFGELAYSERRRGTKGPRLPVHLLSRNLTPWVLTFFLVEFTFLTLFRSPDRGTWLAAAMLVPWFAVPVRLDLSRRVALHVSLVGITVMNSLVFGIEGNQIPEHVTVVVMNALSFLFGALTSKRLRRQTIEEWTERRTSAREQLRMRDELQYAREVQISMLPDAPPSLDWVDLAGTSLPATEVGGDYYDYFVDDDRVAVVCGDVAGHGLGSGIVLASLRTGFALLLESLREPAAVLQRLNDLVAGTSRRRMLATAAVVRLDRASRKATIASAGHPPVLVRRAGTVEAIELFAPPLGVRLPYRVPWREIPIAAGDVFVLHSDGVYESHNAAGESYGLDRLANLVAGSDGISAAEIRDAIICDVEAFRAGAPQDDDLTVVVARVL